MLKVIRMHQGSPGGRGVHLAHRHRRHGEEEQGEEAVAREDDQMARSEAAGITA